MTDKITDISEARAKRVKNDDAPQRLVTVGGLVDETSVSLCIYSDDLIPAEISQILGIAPTRAHRKGEPMQSRSPHAPRDATHRTGAWLLRIRGKAPQEPEQLTTELLDQLPQDEPIWVDLADRYTVWLRYGLHLSAWNRGFALSPELLARIAGTRAQLDFDIYADIEDEEG